MKREKELAEVVVKEWSPAETMMTVGGGRGERFFKIQLIVMKVKRKKKKKNDGESSLACWAICWERERERGKITKIKSGRERERKKKTCWSEIAEHD